MDLKLVDRVLNEFNEAVSESSTQSDSLIPSNHPRKPRTSLSALVEKYISENDDHGNRKNNNNTTSSSSKNNVDSGSHGINLSNSDYSTSEVRPWNYSDFLHRLKSYRQPSHWFAKPDSIDAIVCSRYGWINHGINSLYCTICHNTLIHSSDDWNGNILKDQLANGHDPSCGWRSHQSPEQFRFLQFETIDKERSILLERLVRIIECFRDFNENYGNNNNKSSNNSDNTNINKNISQSNRLIIILDSDFTKIMEHSSDQVNSILGKSFHDHDLDLTSCFDEIIKSLRLLQSDMLMKVKVLDGGLKSLKQYVADVITKYHTIIDENISILIVEHFIGCLSLAISGWSSSTSFQENKEQSIDFHPVGLSCGICRREVLISSFQHRPFNPLDQHRSYCPWISQSSDEWGRNWGWKTFLSRVTHDVISMNSKSSKDQMNQPMDSIGKKRLTEEDSPEKTYKRIRQALKVAVSTTLDEFSNTSSDIV